MIEVEDEGRVRYLTLSRPAQLNALNSGVLVDLADLVRESDRDGVGCLVIRGAGGRAFCAGADLDEMVSLDVAGAHAFIRRGHAAMEAVERSPVPVVAAVDGYALGGGFELVLACHLVVASTSASFGLPEAKIGCIPGFGGTQRLMSAVGRPAAYHLLLTGRRIDAARAWEHGLLSVPPVAQDSLGEEVAELATEVAAGSRPGIRNILEASRRSVRPVALEHEAALAAIAIASPDGKEGIRAFAEKRTPVFEQETR